MGGSSAIVDVDFDLRNRRTATRLPNGGKFLLRLTHDKIMGCAKFQVGASVVRASSRGEINCAGNQPPPKTKIASVDV